MAAHCTIYDLSFQIYYVFRSKNMNILYGERPKNEQKLIPFFPRKKVLTEY